MKVNGKTFIFDLETLGGSPDGVIVSAAFLVFDLNDKESTFEDLVSNALYVKFDVKQQKTLGRNIDQDVLAWWKKQSKEAQAELLPSKNDVKVDEGIDTINKYLRDHGITRKNAFGFCRGQSFDFPLIESLYKTANRFDEWPCMFWNQRDTRTYLGTMVGKLDIKDIPLPPNVIQGFIHHNAVHDIAKDVLSMRYAEMYAFGEAEVPNV